MKNKRRSVRTGIFLLVLLAVLSSGCSRAEEAPDEGMKELMPVRARGKEPEYTVEGLSEACDATISAARSLSPVGEEYVEGMLGIDTDTLRAYVMKIQTSGMGIDQYGIFEAADGRGAVKAEECVRAYLKELEQSWTSFQYLPSELPKLKNARVHREGRFVIYMVLGEDDADLAEGYLR